MAGTGLSVLLVVGAASGVAWGAPDGAGVTAAGAGMTGVTVTGATVTGATATGAEATTGTPWWALAAGSMQTCGIHADGTLWCWGQNYDGQLGDGTQLDRQVPVPVGGGATWRSADTGGARTCGIRADRSLWCWGDNTFGQLGDGADTVTYEHLLPTQVGAGASWSAVATGDYHTCALRTDGTLWCWGLNSEGQLGLGGENQDVRVPTRVGTESTWDTVSAGFRHTCATRTDGTLWCWGQNSGQVGDGTKTNRDQPVRVGAATWVEVSAGRLHTCALDLDGTAWCWGTNSYGQLGDGTRANSLLPVRVGSGTRWASVVAGHGHTCARGVDGTAWCWGDNTDGQLGNGTSAPSSVPTQVTADTTWRDLALGIEHTCGIRPDRTLWCWGGNGYGQLGRPQAPARPVEASPPVGGPSPEEDLPAPIAHSTRAEDVLVQVVRTGGFAGVHNVLFTLRGDGTVVVPVDDAAIRDTGVTRQFTIDEAEVQRVLLAARDAGLLVQAPIDYGHPGIWDAFQFTVTLNAGGRSVTRSAYALEFDSAGFSPAQRAARDALVSFLAGLPRGGGDVPENPVEPASSLLPEP